MARFLHSVVLFLSIGMLSVCHAQITNISNDQATPTPGVGHDYIGTLNEIVSPSNGSLSLRISAPMPAGRGLNLPFQFSYNSNGIMQVNGVNVSLAVHSDLDQRFLEQGGWGYGLPLLSVGQINVPGTNVSHPGSSCPVNTGFVFTDPSGSRHAMGLAIADAAACAAVGVSPQTSYIGGDDYYIATTQSNATSVQDVPFTVADNSGTLFHFPYLAAYTNCSVFCSVPDYIEDRNGNRINITVSGAGTPVNVTDTAGRALLGISSFAKPVDTIAVSGQSTPYTVHWETVPYNFTIHAQAYGSNSQYCGPVGSPNTSGTMLVVSSISLPDGTSYTFNYDSTTGLLDEIKYPTGAFITYTWAPSDTPSDLAQYEDSNFDQNGCSAEYNAYVIHTRTVDNGAGTTQVQTFHYATTFSAAQPVQWTSKKTTVTTTDDTKANHPSFTTTYTYSPEFVGNPPDIVNNVATYVPLEQSIVYQDWNGATLQTVTKTWQPNAQDLLSSMQTTLGNGQTSKTTYSYYTDSANIEEQDDYDYGSGAAGALLRKTVTNFQTFPLLPLSTYRYITNFPCQVLVYNGGNTVVAETDSLYDGGAATCGAAGTPSVASVTGLPSGTHDETYYSASVKTPRGNATTVMRKCLQGCSNASTSYAYDETGQVVSMTDPCGNAACSDMAGTSHTTTYSYTDNPAGGNHPGNSNAYLTKVTQPSTSGAAHIKSYQYSYPNGRLITSIDENSQPTAYQYNDPFSRTTQINYPDGGQTAISYTDSPGNITKTETQKIDGSESLSKTTLYDGLGHATQTQLTSDPYGADTVVSTYDGMGNESTVTNPYRSTSDSTYGVDTYTYDALNRKTSMTHSGDGSTATWTYVGSAVQYTDEGNGTTQVSRVSQSDALGRLLSVCEVSSAPSADGSNPIACGQQIPATGYLTSYSYDALDDLTTVSSGVQTRGFSYDSLSRLQNATNPESGAVSYSYDANSNLQTRTDARGIKTTYTYDALDRVTNRSYSDGSAAVAYLYDVPTTNWTNNSQGSYLIGRLTGVFQTYNGMVGTKVGVIYGYDLMGRMTLSSSCTPATCGNSHNDILYTYNLAGNVNTETTTSHYPAIALTYEYDSADRLGSISSSWSDTTHPPILMQANAYTQSTLGLPPYLAVGLQAAQFGLTDASQPSGIVEARGYDTRVRLNQIAYDSETSGDTIQGPILVIQGTEQSSGSTFDTGSVTLTINGITASVTYGSTSTADSIASALANAFDSVNIVVQQGQPIPDEPFLTANGNDILVTTTQPGTTASFPFNASITYNSGVFAYASFAINPTSGTLRATSGNPSPANLYSAAIQYAPDGVVTTVFDSSPSNWFYGYDPMNRLISAMAPEGNYAGANIAGANLSWSYDAHGNRWGQAATGTSAFPSSWAKYSTANRVTSATLAPAGYSYDASGNVMNDGLNQYLYDAEGRMCAVKSNLTGGLTGYIYDAGGKRVAKGSLNAFSCDMATNGFVTSHSYILDRDGQQTYEMDGSGNWIHTNVYANGELLATYNPAAVHFYLEDWLGTKRGQASVTTSNTTATTTSELTCWSLPFGDDLICNGPGPDATEHHFTGKERDTESGNDYFMARYYASNSAGRFLSPDPSQLSYADPNNPQSLNLYSYVRNNPLSLVDLFGLATQMACQAGSPDSATTSYTDTSTIVHVVGNVLTCTPYEDGKGQIANLIPHKQPTILSPSFYAALDPRNKNCTTSARVVQGTLGVANLADAYVRATALPGAVAALAGAPPVAAIAAIYGVTSIFGQALSGSAQIFGAITGNNSGSVGGAQQAGNILAGPASGLGTLVATGGDLATAERNANIESLYNGGVGLVNKATPLMQRSAEVVLGAAGVSNAGCH